IMARQRRCRFRPAATRAEVPVNILRQTADVFAAWIDVVATTINTMFDRVGSKRPVRLVEEADDTFVFQIDGDAKGAAQPDHRIRITADGVVGTLPKNLAATLHGSRAELVLRPSRFLFRPLELPQRAPEYLAGIVRPQIDRLTPWSANEAAYSWTPPVDITNDRIHLTIAATARSKIMPYLAAIADFGAASVAVATTAPGADGKPA